MRLSQTRPRRHHTQWRVFPDSTLGGLPTLEDLLVEVSHIARSPNSRGSTTQVWDGNILVELSPEEWKDGPKRILEGKAMSTRVFNMPKRHVIADSETMEYSAFASTAIGQIYSPSDGRNIVKRMWAVATFGYDENYGKQVRRGSSLAEKVLDDFGPELVRMGRKIWDIQAQALAKASFIAGSSVADMFDAIFAAVPRLARSCVYSRTGRFVAVVFIEDELLL